MRNLISYISLLVVALIAPAQNYSPGMMPNVNLNNRYEFISDPGNLMGSEAKAKVNSQLWEIRQQTSAEIVVAIPPSIGETPIEDWCEQLFTLWGIGKKDRDNGLLIVIAPEQRKTRIQTGYGMEGVLPDIACKHIIGLKIVPAMRENNLDLAVEGAVSLIAEALSDPEVAEELKSDLADNYSGNITSLSGKELWGYIKFIAGCVFLFTLAFVVYNFFALRRSDNFHKAVRWREQLPLYVATTIFSLGSAIPLLLISFLLYRFYRTRRRECPTCRAAMQRLNETEDNDMLSPSQDFEEKLNTVDYDVWVCHECGTVEKFPFITKQTKYTECPNCHTIAMCEIENRIITPATSRRTGYGEKIYECKFCHHQNRTGYTIPKEDNTGPLAAGAILGSLSGSGGGSFGGGFGGGATGGGGASGSW